MKTRVLIVVGWVLASLPVAGTSQESQSREVSCFKRISSYTSQHLERAAQNLGASLTSENDGVVASSIRLSTLLRVADPPVDLCAIRTALHDLAVSGRTPSLRYKAFLATIVFDDPTAFKGALDVVETDDDEFFSYISAKVSRTLFGYKGE